MHFLEITKEESKSDYHLGTYGKYFYRLAWYKIDEDCGNKSCYHTIDGNKESLWHFADLCGVIEFSTKHEDVDLGRAKKMTSKAKKIIESL